METKPNRDLEAMNTKKAKTCLMISPDVLAAAYRQAKREDRTKSALVERAIREYLVRHATQPPVGGHRCSA